MTGLRVSDLTIEYEQGDYVVRPIENLEAEADDGELVLLLGPSGSGKTTLLSCLAGLLRPTSGTIHVGDTEVTSLSGPALTAYRRHGVGIVFQAFNLIASLTVAENVAAPLRLGRVGRAETAERVDAVLERVGLADLAGRRPAALSGGQQQRVALARALVHDPPLIVADEPTAHLDYVAVEEVLSLIRELAAPGRLVVVATHDDRFTPLADRVVELAPGRAREDPAERRVELAAGTVLFEQGDAADYVYVVESGNVEILRARPGGGEKILAVIGPGAFFGELGPLLGLPRSATARAWKDCVLTAYGPAEFRGLRRDAGPQPPRDRPPLR